MERSSARGEYFRGKAVIDGSRKFEFMSLDYFMELIYDAVNQTQNMSEVSPVSTGGTQGFPHLSHAPIAEAVVELRCQPRVTPVESEWGKVVRAELPTYSIVKPLRGFELETRLRAGQPPEQKTHDLGWDGYRAETEDHLQVAQFFRDRFAFSRLAPYKGWSVFQSEALRVWNVYARLAEPTNSQRLGLRFINRLPMLAGESVDPSPHLRLALSAPVGLDLPFTGFFHQETLVEPEHGYEIRIVKTLQPPGPGGGVPQLILDIDVSCVRSFEVTPSEIGTRLEDMRHLKNKVFFGSITPAAQGRFE